MTNSEDSVITLESGSEENTSAEDQHESSFYTVKPRINNGILVDETPYRFPCFIRASPENMPHAIEHLMRRFDAATPFQYRILPPSIIRTSWMEAVVWFPDDKTLQLFPGTRGVPTYWFTSMALAQLRTNMMFPAKEEAGYHSTESSQKRSGDYADEDESPLLKKARH